MDRKVIVFLKNEVAKDPELLLNHIYDMGDKWLFSVKSKKEIDLMDPYYIADKKTLKISNFAFQKDIEKFKEALKNKVY